jgi:hypothetical protein
MNGRPDGPLRAMHSLTLGCASFSGLVPINAPALTKSPYFSHLEFDCVDCWERLGKELKVSKHQVNRTESTGHMSLVRAHNPLSGMVQVPLGKMGVRTAMCGKITRQSRWNLNPLFGYGNTEPSLGGSRKA